MKPSRIRGVSTLLFASIAAALGLLAPPTARAAPLLSLVTTVTAPVYITHARDARLFIVEQQGRIRIVDRSSGSLLASPFLDIRAKVSSGGERGLLSVAFHPQYETNGYFYVDYTNLQGNTVIERYRVSSNRNLADTASGVTLLLIGQPFANHNGGQLQVGPDGYLYVGMGDGGSAGDPACRAQRTDTLLGKMLRLDISRNLNTAPFYAIPADNPFVGAADPGGLIPDEIWALGLRNPWRFSFDRTTGDMFIADVGQNQFEEIDLHRSGSPGGQNFGWKVMEGAHCFSNSACPAGTPACNDPGLSMPIHEYSHASGCSITGGYVYRGAKVPELFGRYVFGDYCGGDLRALREITPNTWTSEGLLQAGTGLTSFGEDSDGELYVAVGNDVHRVVSDQPPAAVPAIQPLARVALGVGLLALAAIKRSGPRVRGGRLRSARAPRDS